MVMVDGWRGLRLYRGWSWGCVSSLRNINYNEMEKIESKEYYISCVNGANNNIFSDRWITWRDWLNLEVTEGIVQDGSILRWGEGRSRRSPSYYISVIEYVFVCFNSTLWKMDEWNASNWIMITIANWFENNNLKLLVLLSCLRD